MSIDFGDRYPVPDENEPQPRSYQSPGQVAAMSDAQLADHIEAGTHDDDGTSFSVRIALARILRRTAFAAPAVTRPPPARHAQQPTSPESADLLLKAQAFVDRKYVARADARQKGMGLAYVEAERQDLAREIVRFVESLDRPAQQPASPVTETDPDLMDCFNALLLIEHGLSEPMANRIVKQWREKCEALHRAQQPASPDTDDRPEPVYTYLLCACGLETRVRCAEIGCPDAKESKRGRR